MQALTTTNKYWSMVSESFGFTGPYICWAVQGTLGNSDSQWIITITKDSPYNSMVILIKRQQFSLKQRRKISGFYGIFQIFPGSTLPKPRYPSQGTQAMLTQETKKVWTLQPKPSHARGAAWGAAQARCSSAALPSDYITRPVALVQHCSIAAEEQQACSSSREAEEHLSGMCVA